MNLQHKAENMDYERFMSMNTTEDLLYTTVAEYSTMDIVHIPAVLPLKAPTLSFRIAAI